MVRVVWRGPEEGCHVTSQKELRAAQEQAPQVEWCIGRKITFVYHHPLGQNSI